MASAGAASPLRPLGNIRWGTVLLGHVRGPVPAIQKLFLPDAGVEAETRRVLDTGHAPLSLEAQSVVNGALLVELRWPCDGHVPQ